MNVKIKLIMLNSQTEYTDLSVMLSEFSRSSRKNGKIADGGKLFVPFSESLCARLLSNVVFAHLIVLMGHGKK